jgi:hypothetical protein
MVRKESVFENTLLSGKEALNFTPPLPQLRPRSDGRKYQPKDKIRNCLVERSGSKRLNRRRQRYDLFFGFH